MWATGVAWRSIGMLGDSLRALGAHVKGVGRLCGGSVARGRPKDAPLPPKKRPKRPLLLFFLAEECWNQFGTKIVQTMCLRNAKNPGLSFKLYLLCSETLRTCVEMDQ